MPAKPVSKFPVNELLIGLQRNPKDQALLKYVAFLCGEIHPDRVAMLHVIPADSNPIGVLYPPATIALDPEYEEKLIAELESSAAPHFSGLNIPKSYLVKGGAPLDQLVATANDRGANLVVVGKRRGTSWHTILVKNMIRQLTARIMMVPETAEAKLNTIFVPIDFSQNSIRALRNALAIREESGRDIRILAVNVYQRPDLMAFNLSMTAAEFKRQVEANHREGFANFVAENFPGKEDQIEPLLIQNEDPDIAYILHEKATEEKADLIMIGARGHSKLAVLLLGSTAESLLNINASIPTMIVK
jgi:nucleotide-binding universal stress UspA family protein